MIEVRIDIDHMQRHQHNVMHSILMMNVLREAGMPVIGKIIFNGPERGRIVQWRESDLDNDTWVVQWFDDKEPQLPMHKFSRFKGGQGKGFTWVEYRDETFVNTLNKEDDDL